MVPEEGPHRLSLAPRAVRCGVPQGANSADERVPSSLLSSFLRPRFEDQRVVPEALPDSLLQVGERLARDLGVRKQRFLQCHAPGDEEAVSVIPGFPRGVDPWRVHSARGGIFTDQPAPGDPVHRLRDAGRAKEKVSLVLFRIYDRVRLQRVVLEPVRQAGGRADAGAFDLGRDVDRDVADHWSEHVEIAYRPGDDPASFGDAAKYGELDGFGSGVAADARQPYRLLSEQFEAGRDLFVPVRSESLPPPSTGHS